LKNLTLDFIEEFKEDKLCVVIGSSWPEDEKLLINYINNEAPDDTKFIIAPHNIKIAQIKNLKTNLKKDTVLFSEKENHNLKTFEVLIIDTIGLLSKIYNYADIAYVGGAMGKTGLHNTLEPAVFGIPIIIGKNHNKFPEAQAMIDNNGLMSISNQSELNIALNEFLLNEEKRLLFGDNNRSYIKQNEGSVVQILNFLRK